MHDPKAVAHTIVRPWPSRDRHWKPTERWSIRYQWARWYDWRPRTIQQFWVVAGVRLYWPPLVTIWHNEPGGHDFGEVCCTRKQRKNSEWYYTRGWTWHVHHWSLQIHPWQHFRRWALTRCEWCGGPSRKGDQVNHSKSWGRAKDSWWRGERGLFHQDCSTIEGAHRTCACGIGPWEHGVGGSPYGQCQYCEKYLGWSEEPRDTTPTRILQSIPEGQRDAAKYAQAVRDGKVSS